ncbi:tyrosine-type recombinase/integrase [Parasphingopyxis sp.]|uniref:tyrosine-type recombinase/integrase n=1 Tax=Parasphingopyxis sp. TaxID=1920299 RepID=UPI00261C191F|nr:tyrosine-type recombinase/integrase [Parasphingopyxis sp.]
MGARSNRNRKMETLASLVALYERTVLPSKSAGTQRTYGFYLHRLATEHGKAPVKLVERRHVRKMIRPFEDRGNLGAANLMLAVTRNVFAVAVKRDMIERNPCDGIDRHELGEHDPWPVWLVEKALVDPDPLIRRSVGLLYYTAQRIGDVCRMTWRDIEHGRIKVVQQKTGTPLVIQLHSGLVEILGRPEGITLLGHPAKPEALRRRIKLWAKGHGADIVPHGLRKNAVIALLEAGCSVAETAAISGQSYKMVEHYAKKIDQEKMGTAAILKWENKK